MSHQKKVSYVSVQDSSNQKTSVIQYTRKWRLSKLVRKIKCELKLNDSNFRLVQKDGSIIENIKDVKDNEQLYIVRADADTELKTKTQNMNPGDDNDNWVKLNIGGKIFYTTKTTLMKDSTSIFAKMFENGWNTTRDSNGCYLFDRSPDYFEYILNFLRSGKLIFDKGVNIEGILEEVYFYNITSMMKPLHILVEQSRTDLTRKEFIKILASTSSGSTLRLQGLNLSGINLSNLDLSNINFKNAILRNANLSGCDLTNTNFENADLSYCNLQYVVLGGSNLSKANLIGADLTGADLDCRNGVIANLVSSKLDNSILVDTNLGGADLRFASFKNSKIENSIFRDANLSGANLKGAKIMSCNLYKCNLKGANFEDSTVDVITVSSR